VFTVYLLRSLSDPTRTYVGRTKDLRKRLSDHNCGHSLHTAKHRPWELVVSVTFKEQQRAVDFEAYLTRLGTGQLSLLLTLRTDAILAIFSIQFAPVLAWRGAAVLFPMTENRIGDESQSSHGMVEHWNSGMLGRNDL
jgi:predicted GIY-YIG superfamily endonuclease